MMILSWLIALDNIVTIISKPIIKIIGQKMKKKSC